MKFDSAAFGHRVKAARVWAHLEPKELSVRLGLSDEWLYEIERGERENPPKKLQLEALARELGQPADWLLKGDGPPWSTFDGPDAGAELAEVAEVIADALERLQRFVSVPGHHEAGGSN